MTARGSKPSSTGTGASIPWRDLPEVSGPWLSSVDLARPHGRRGHLGHGAGNTDRRSGCRNPDRLVGLGRLHDRPRPSAREEHHPAHGGLDRTTRNPREEPADHGLGRSRSGLSTKTHQLVDGAGREGVLIAGDRHPSARRWHQGRPPQPADQQGHRRRRGSAGGRPVGLDSEAYTGRNVIERQDACQGPLSSAHRRPVFLPAGGHQNCPLVASWFARLGGGAGHRDGISSVA